MAVAAPATIGAEPAAGQQHEGGGDDHRGEERLHRDRGADAEPDPHRPAHGHLVAPPQDHRHRRGGEGQRRAVGGDRAR